MPYQHRKYVTSGGEIVSETGEIAELFYSFAGASAGDTLILSDANGNIHRIVAESGDESGSVQPKKPIRFNDNLTVTASLSSGDFSLCLLYR